MLALAQELPQQLDALAAKDIPRDKIFSQKFSTPAGPPTVRGRLAAAREIKARTPRCRVIFTVYEMKRWDAMPQS